MKRGIFMLTKSEQRVVVLIVLALLIGAFIRYWRDANEQKALNRQHPVNAVATPVGSSPTIEPDPDDDSDALPNKSP